MTYTLNKDEPRGKEVLNSKITVAYSEKSLWYYMKGKEVQFVAELYRKVQMMARNKL